MLNTNISAAINIESAPFLSHQRRNTCKRGDSEMATKPVTYNAKVNAVYRELSVAVGSKFSEYEVMVAASDFVRRIGAEQKRDRAIFRERVGADYVVAVDMFFEREVSESDFEAVGVLATDWESESYVPASHVLRGIPQMEVSF
jgi:hypothetical protein